MSNVPDMPVWWDLEPTDAELAAIEADELPLIEAELRKVGVDGGRVRVYRSCRVLVTRNRRRRVRRRLSRAVAS